MVLSFVIRLSRTYCNYSDPSVISIIGAKWGDGVAKMVERQTQDPKDEGLNPRLQHKKNL